VERACELLSSANLNVTEICHLVGFASLGTFSARFAEITGMSPTAYRRQAAEGGGPAPIPGCFVLMWQTGLPANASLPEKRSQPPRTSKRTSTRPPSPGAPSRIHTSASWPPLRLRFQGGRRRCSRFRSSHAAS
jgi:Helix-turn-helix domain